VTPTVYGDVMIRHAKLILTQLRHASEELDSLEEGLSGRINIGTLLAASPTLLPRSIAIMREQRPNIAVTVVDGTNDKLMPSLRTGDLDIVLGRLPDYREREGLTQELLYDEPVAIVVGQKNPLAKKKKISLGDLCDLPWIMPSVQTSLRRQIETAFRSEDLEPPADVVESVSILTNHSLLLDTDMVGAMPYQVASVQQGLTILPISLAAQAGRVGATTRSDVELSATARYFMTVVRGVAEDIQKEMESR